MDLTSLIYALMTLAVAFYFFVKWRYNYWSSRNVVALEPSFFYGNLRTKEGKDITLIDAVVNAYKAAKAKGERYAGIYLYMTPQFVPLDRDIIKSVLHTNFDHFINRGIHVDEKRDPLSGNLFNLSDAKWKNLRKELSPDFTIGKTKTMFESVQDCAKVLEEVLNERTTVNEPVDIKDILARFTTDNVGSAIFGLDFKSLKNANPKLKEYGKFVYEDSWRKRFSLFLDATFPTSLTNLICAASGFSYTKKRIDTYFMDMVENAVDYREKNNVLRKDALNRLIQLKNKGSEDLKGDHKNGLSGGISMSELAAQAYIFYFAGFEPAANTLNYAMLELAQNQDVQEKLREEIKETLEKNDNKLTCEALLGMEYLDKVLCETMRKHAPLHRLLRMCNKDFKVPNSDLVIKANTQVCIPVLAIHNDPEYYPNPEKFDPERFSKENKASRPSMTYFPFGDGPRGCLGVQFGKLQAKLGLFTIVSKFKFTLNESTKFPLEFDLKTVMIIRDGLWLNFERLEQ